MSHLPLGLESIPLEQGLNYFQTILHGNCSNEHFPDEDFPGAMCEGQYLEGRPAPFPQLRRPEHEVSPDSVCTALSAE
jgi:hypothetical protein